MVCLAARRGDGFWHIEEQGDETSQRRFFGTYVPQNDKKECHVERKRNILEILRLKLRMTEGSKERKKYLFYPRNQQQGGTNHTGVVFKSGFFQLKRLS